MIPLECGPTHLLECRPSFSETAAMIQHDTRNVHVRLYMHMYYIAHAKRTESDMSASHISPRAPSQLTPLSVHPYTRPACARRARGGGALSPHAPRFARRHSQCMQMTTNAAPALRRRRCSHRRVAAPQLDARHSTNSAAVRYCGYCSARQVDRKGSAQPQFRSLPQMALQRDAYGVGEEAYCQPQGAASAGACCRRRSVAHTRGTPATGHS